MEIKMMMRRKSVLIAVAVLAVIAGIFAYQNLPTTSTSSTNTPMSFRLAWVYDMAEVGVFIAQDKGYFRDEQIDLKIEPGGFGLDPIKLVAAGTDDFGVAGAGNLLLARAQGVPVVAIGAEFQDTPVGFVVRKDSGITTFKDFRGKRVGIQTGADTDVLYRALLARNGMKSSDVKEVPIRYDAIPFVSGQIDVLPGYVTNQPVTLRSQNIEVSVISASSQGLNYYGNVYFTSEKMLREHPERVRGFLAAVSKGWNTAIQDEATAIAAVQSRSPDFNANDLKTIYAAVMPFIRPEDGQPLLSMTAQRWATTGQVLVDAGLLKINDGVSKVYTNDFVR
jgi:NitT/TauT family transport system substrate-binding protein